MMLSCPIPTNSREYQREYHMCTYLDIDVPAPRGGLRGALCSQIWAAQKVNLAMVQAHCAHMIFTLIFSLPVVIGQDSSITTLWLVYNTK